MSNFHFLRLRLAFCLAFLCLSTAAHSQGLLFEKTYGAKGLESEGEGVMQMADNGFLIAATYSVPNGAGGYQEDILVIRTNSSGDTVWTKRYGGSTTREFAESMSPTYQGDIVIVGYVVTPSSGDYNAYLLTIDGQGNELWSKSVGSPTANEMATGILSMGDEFYVCGHNYSVAGNNADAWLFKMDMTGNLKWQKTFGGTEYDDAWDVDITEEGGCMLTGGTYSFAAGQYDDAWLIKTDSSGNMIWRKTYGLADRVDWAWSLTVLTSGGRISGYAFTGVKDTEESGQGSAYSSLHLVQVDTAGTIVWDKSIAGPPGDFRKEGFDIKRTFDGGLVIAGWHYTMTNVDLYVIKTDALGNATWDTSYSSVRNTVYRPQSLNITSDSGFAITGSIATSRDSQSIFLCRFGYKPTAIAPTRKSPRIHTYPNPVTDQLSIVNDQSCALTIVNALGQRVWFQDLKPGKSAVPMQEFHSGYYWITAYFENGETYSKRVIKQ